MNHDEINRLVALGLGPATAISVLSGELDMDFEVQRANARRDANVWAQKKHNRAISLTAAWDLEPSRFYLSLDGVKPSDFNAASITVIAADVAEVAERLAPVSTRDKDPWSKEFASKTKQISYLWASGLQVTLNRPGFVGGSNS